MLKYIIAAVLVALVWAIVWVLSLPIWIAIAFTLAVVGFLAGLWFWRRARARKAARDIERALSAQAEQYARSVRPEQQAEIRAMQEEFTKAVASLKNSKIGKGSGADALYALPWYMIIGPPGTGKSTALKNSGLQFPYLSSSGGGVKGVGGTRNCEWWLTNEAVLLDTAGRYTTEEDDKDEWLAFLDMLKRNRPRKPLNGVLVAVSVGDLGGAHESDVQALAKRIRERIDEVMGRLQMVVPVYLLFTKCDLIPGFVEMFGDLRKQERGQIWGFTVPLAERPKDPAEYTRERFDELASVVEQRALKRLGQERRLETREKIYEFPQQFEVLRTNICEFVGALFAENVYQGTPIMRGAYFTSGTQEGRPIDRVMASMAEAFGIARRAVTQANTVIESKSYFLRDVFSKVVFPDQDVAARSAEEIRREKLRRIYVAAGAFGMAALISFLPAYAFSRNRDLLRTTRAIAEAVASAHQDNGGPIPLATLDPLRQRVAELREYEIHSPPTFMRFGLYRGSEVYPHVRDFYTATLRRDVLAPIVRRDVNDMDEFGRRFEAMNSRPSREEFQQYYDTLKTHLFLTTPAEPAQPRLGSNERRWLTDQIVARWVRGSDPNSNANNDATRQLMRANAQIYVDLLAGDPRLAFDRNPSAVRRVRAALVNIPIVNLAVDQIVAEVEPMGYGLTLESIIGNGVTSIRSAPSNRVRGAFTRRGWEEYVRSRLTATLEQITGEPWVLGRTPDRNEQARREEDIARIRSQYFAMYIDEWRNFLGGLRVPDPGNNSETLLMLQELTRGEPPPFGALFRAVAYNTHLEDPQPTATQSALQQVQAGVIANLRRRLAGRSQVAANAVNAAMNRAAQNGNGQEEQLFEREDVEASFQGFFRFGANPSGTPAPPAAGGTPPAAPPTPAGLRAYQEQLEFVRDALVTYQENPNGPTTPLLNALQTARTRVEALINEQEIGWRPRFRALLWPPISGAVHTSANSIGEGTGNRWCSEVVVPFERTLRGRYPFDRHGQDAAIADVADFYRPDTGRVWAFYGQALRNDVPRRGDHFEFSENLGTGTDEVYRGELVQFLDRTQDITTVMFPTGQNQPEVRFEVRIRPTPRIATLTFTVDGQEIEYHNGPEQWHQMRWPGEGRVRGASIRARGEGIDETVAQEGEWGLFRLLEEGVVRGTPSARIFSVTWTLRDANMEVGVDIRPARSENPFLGIPRRDDSATGIVRPFRVEGVAAPHMITRLGHPCDVSGVPSPRARRSRHRRGEPTSFYGPDRVHPAVRARG